ncbi:related to ethanolamine utilization protein (EutN) [Desulfotalea psychrophila LSv54]|uniref:Related to ethanolamine utilization protein (EutN) n=2 Tax=Desulfotalea psychrophila TaxID=84980 RepID=Q6AIR1_DESPS|nr:related to ethanolamine utilization protein (EutN) [Desulfotalea psychrophila LSv54]
MWLGRKSMELARVRGQVVATIRDPKVPHTSLLLVDFIRADGVVRREGHVAADTLGAGEGEYVLLVRGSGAALVVGGGKPPIDLSVVAIVDQISALNEVIYSK